MNPLWLVENGNSLRAMSINRPTKSALVKTNLGECSVRLSPVAPTQLGLAGVADTFNLSAQNVRGKSTAERDTFGEDNPHTQTFSAHNFGTGNTARPGSGEKKP